MRLKYFALVAVVALLTACTNQESLLKDYEKACQKGNVAKAEKILEKMEKEYPNEEDWTQEQQERIVKASAVLSEKALGGLGDLFDAVDGL